MSNVGRCKSAKHDSLLLLLLSLTVVVISVVVITVVVIGVVIWYEPTYRAIAI